MRKKILLAMCLGALALPLDACNDQDTIPVEQTFGPSPSLPPPQKSWIPTVNIAPAVGWPPGGKPVAANGMAVNAFATGLDHPRTVYVLPNGDVLVAESNAPPKPDDTGGIKGWITRMIMRRAGAGVPSANRITLLRDADGDGVAETKTVFIDGLNSPFGMALVRDDFYVANTDAIVRFPYHEGDAKITAPGVKLADLPAGTINHHWTKDLTASPDGTKLYATVGSNSNVGENGIEAEANRAAVLEVDRASGQWRVGRTYGFARTDIQHRQSVSARDGQWRLHRPARLVESQTPRGLQGDLRAVRRWQALRHAAGRADRFPQRQGRGAGTPGRRQDRQAGRAAGGRRCRQRGVARDASGEVGGKVSVPRA
jgi:glucose/arabinose dehydrogenase